ncbi:MAG: DUF4147 domain-containing protein, partial [Candidatus Heimdallarchaeota archaeon]|nr:DUF4147 domain-containing protein [Candidatus Heimdallarchaeota archaeon]
VINPAQFVTLIMSDVIGDQISMIASGPTVEYFKSFKDVKKIIRKYQIEENLPAAVRDFIEEGVKDCLKDGLNKSSKGHQDTKNIIIGNLDSAIQEAARIAAEYGFQTKIITNQLGGEAREQGVNLAKHLIDFKRLNKDITKPVCFIAGGETTVTLQGRGKGGRNQELALAAAIELKQIADCAIVTFATDGEDGPTDAAGGIVNGDTLVKGEKIGLCATEFLKNNDSYSYLKALDSLITTGSTGTNVNDLVFLFSF